MNKAVAEKSRIHDAGKGPAVIYLRADGASSRAGALLTGEFRVLTAASGSLESARNGIDKFCIVAHGAAANEALSFAEANAQAVEAILLLAPPATPPDRFAELKTPVMIFLGTKDKASPPAVGAAWKRALANGHLTFVYDAGAEMDNERPEAVAAALKQFLSERERFLVSKASGVLYP